MYSHCLQGASTFHFDRRTASSSYTWFLYVLRSSFNLRFLMALCRSDDSVRQQTDEEKNLYKRLAAITGRPAPSLSSRWREPSLTVHSIEISGPKSSYARLGSSILLTDEPTDRCYRYPGYNQVSSIASHRARSGPRLHCKVVVSPSGNLI